MKIAYVGSPELFSRGASSIHVMKMCQAISNLGMEVELILPHFSSGRDIFSYYGVNRDFRIKKIFPSIKKGGLRHVMHGALSALYTAPRRKGYSLVITRNIIYAFFSTKLLRIPTVYDAHHPLVGGAAKVLFDSFKGSKNLRKFSTNSKGLAEIYLEMGLPKEKLVVAPNGVDVERFSALPDKIEARKRVGLYQNRPEEKIVCYAGNTYPGRGVELLIEVSRRLPGVRFIVVGGLEEDTDRLRGLARAVGVQNFELVGFVPHTEVPLYLAASDILVMPYTMEMTIKGGTNASLFTSPIKLFEYMASGTPIVASSLPSIGEILDDRRNAVLVEPNSAEALREGIEAVLHDAELRESISREAKREAALFTWEERAKKLIFE